MYLLLLFLRSAAAIDILISLSPLSPGVVLSLDDGGVSLGDEPSVSLSFPQDTTHLHLSLKTVQ
jgi:hypothetical protein